MRLMVQKHSYKPSRTTVIICYKEKESISLSCKVLIQPYSCFSGYDGQKKWIHFYSVIFPTVFDTWIHVRNVTNRRKKKLLPWLVLVLLQWVPTHCMAQVAQMDSLLLFFVCHEKYAGRQGCLKCSIAPGLQMQLILCCYPAWVQINVDISHSFIEFKTDKFKHSLKMWKLTKTHKYTSISCGGRLLQRYLTFSFPYKAGFQLLSTSSLPDKLL